MNLNKLKAAETRFLLNYPGGFEHPAMQAIAKKHKVDKMCQLAQEGLTLEAFDQPDQIIELLQKLVSRSSLVSVFEKPKFKDALNSMNQTQRKALAESIQALLHGNESEGFEGLGCALAPYKLDKWPLMTVIQAYYEPDKNPIFKPTTVKGILSYFEIDEIKYSSRPSFDFYVRYRAIIQEMQHQVDPTLAPSMTAFCGFLMMSMADGYDTIQL